MRLLNSLGPSDRVRVALWGGLILLLVLVFYYPALQGGFIWDDDVYVTHNPLLTAPDGLSRIWFSQHFQSQYFPLVYTTLRAEHALWGLNPFGYHLINVLLHGANALLLWALLRRLELPGAWLAAAIFALHPVGVESVAWVTELKNTESTLFYLLALLAWLRFTGDGTSQHRGYYALAMFLYVLALFSKTTACTLPAAMVLVLWLRKLPIDRRRMLQLVPFLAAGLVMGWVSVWWEGHLGNYAQELGLSFTLPERLLIATRALWFYAGKLIWPAHLAFSYARWHINAREPLQYFWPAATLAVALLLWRRRDDWSRGTIVAAAFFVAALSPMLGFVSEYTFRFSFVADHYQYLASAGLIAWFAGAATRAAERLRVNAIARIVLAALLLAVLGGLTWRQAGVYRNPETLWRDTLAKNPGSWMAHYNLGLWLSGSGQGGEAMEHFRAAIRLNPNHAKARVNLGLELAKTGRLDEAVRSYSEALKIEPGFALAHYDLGTTLAIAGRPEEAIGHLRTAVGLDPALSAAWGNLVTALAKAGRKDEALECLRQRVLADPKNLEALYNLAVALASEGQLAAAVDTYYRALQVSPNNISILNNLGNALFMLGRRDEAIGILRQAAQSDPKNPGVHFNLAMMLLQQGMSPAHAPSLPKRSGSNPTSPRPGGNLRRSHRALNQVNPVNRN